MLGILYSRVLHFSCQVTLASGPGKSLNWLVELKLFIPRILLSEVKAQFLTRKPRIIEAGRQSLHQAL